MPIRTVKQYSDRGSIKNLAKPVEDREELAPTTSELRIKKLFEFARQNKDQGLQSAIGFITTDYISDKNALPLSVYRIRQIVADIKAASPGKIDQLSREFESCIKDELSPETIAYINKKHTRIKTASLRKVPFWRARKV